METIQEAVVDLREVPLNCRGRILARLHGLKCGNESNYSFKFRYDFGGVMAIKIIDMRETVIRIGCAGR
ncbi:MAG: hypothetical protein ACRD18_15845 [Terriglobia bacterium]